jgi:hypothetical protein
MNIGAEGAAFVGAALKHNHSLVTLECVRSVSHELSLPLLALFVAVGDIDHLFTRTLSGLLSLAFPALHSVISYSRPFDVIAPLA